MIRQSKFRHVYGQHFKKEDCFEDIRVTKSAWDGTFCAVNTKYIAIVTDGGGGSSFLVLKLSQTGRLNYDHPSVCGHRSQVTDLSWCPHKEELIASASDDMTVKIWQIPETGLKRTLTTPIVELNGHQKRVSQCIWHPTAVWVLLSSGWDNKIIFWDASKATVLREMVLPDYAFCCSFNLDGSRLAAVCKDKQLRVIDPIKGTIVANGPSHPGAKPSQVSYCRMGKILTTGFSRMAERQLSYWDENDLSEPLCAKDVDNSNGVLFPFVDPDLNIFYLIGKGDITIRYYEIIDDPPYIYELDMYQDKEPQRGFGFLPKRSVDVNKNEIARFYKLYAKGLVEPIEFLVPRKAEHMFQEDIYPDTPGPKPSCTAEEWLNGADSSPKLISMRDGFIETHVESMPKGNVSSAFAFAMDDSPEKEKASSTSELKSGGMTAAAHSTKPTILADSTTTITQHSKGSSEGGPPTSVHQLPPSISPKDQHPVHLNDHTSATSQVPSVTVNHTTAPSNVSSSVTAVPPEKPARLAVSTGASGDHRKTSPPGKVSPSGDQKSPQDVVEKWISNGDMHTLKPVRALCPSKFELKPVASEPLSKLVTLTCHAMMSYFFTLIALLHTLGAKDLEKTDTIAPVALSELGNKILSRLSEQNSHQPPSDFDYQGVLSDIRKLKIIVKGQERRIKHLEEEIEKFNPKVDLDSL